MDDLVSVIMPTHNAGRFVADSISSVLGQTYRNLELLVTDDCSTDAETRNILTLLQQKDPRVKVEFLSENHGPGYARNRAIERAKGRYIAFCDSDDRWFPEKLEKQIAFMRKKDCALTCTSYLICDDNGQVTGIQKADRRISFNMMKRDNKVGCLTAVYDVVKLGRKFYMPTIRKRQDWALFLSIVQHCHIAYGLEEPLAYYRDRAHSVSSNKLSLVKYNVAVYHDILHFSKLKSYFYFFFLFLPAYAAKKYRQRRDSKALLEGK